MIEKAKIQYLLDDFNKSTPQSEAEIRTKFIVPLLECLGYPSELRAEEFPIYGYSGRDLQRPKPADFLLFSDPNFAHYRTHSYENQKWVQDHSLLIIEAKNTGKLAEIPGQVQYYTMWTKAIAYVETDGVEIYGYFYSPISSDPKIININISELTNSSTLEYFSYSSILAIKESTTPVLEKLLASVDLLQNTTHESDKNENNIDVPDEIVDYMRQSLGRNADGFNTIELINAFQTTTNTLLQNKLRYDIPPYILDFQRNEYPAKIYINNQQFPFCSGFIAQFFWNDIDRYIFCNDILHIFIEYKREKITRFEIGYQVLDLSVKTRLRDFDTVISFLNSKQILIDIENESFQKLSIPVSTFMKTLWTLKDEHLMMCSFWKHEMNKLKAIEEYYDITFKLKLVNGQDQINTLYQAIDFVYDGIMLQENCSITLPGNIFDDDLEITQPILLHENYEIPLNAQQIHNYTFKPNRSAILPCVANFKDKIETDIVRLPACCEYSIVN